MARKGKKTKLPKRIAGVKIPKHLRRSGGQMLELLQKPMVTNVVADVLAAGLIAAADSVARRETARRASGSPGGVDRPGQEAVEAAATRTIDMGAMLAAAAREGARAISAKLASRR